MQLKSAAGQMPKRGIAALSLFAVTASTALIFTSPAVAQTEAAPVVESGQTSWRYLDTDVDPNTGLPEGSTWTGASFDDTAWPEAKGSFGAKKSGTTATVDYSSTVKADNLVNYFGVDGSSVTRTHFFRATFDLTADQLAAADFFDAKTLSDDGIIIYVNGVEVARNDVAKDTPTLAYASGSSTSLDQVDFRVAKDILVAGKNTIAVAVHQDRPASSDIFFDFVSLTPAKEIDAATAPPTRLILTPTETPETSQSFTWQASNEDAASGTVQIKPSAGGSVRSVKAYNQGAPLKTVLPHFSSTVTGLKPATEYTYRVGNGQSWSEWYEFTTADPNATDFQYLYYGDAQIGLDTTWPDVVRQAEAKAPNSIGSVHAGDLIDTSSNDTQWKNWFKGMETSAATTNVMAAPGNHEYSGDKLMEAWKAHFEYPLNQPNTSTIGDLAKKAEGDSDVAKQYAAYFEHWSNFAAETVYFTDYQGVRFITINATRDSTFLKPDNLPSCTGTEEVPCPSKDVSRLWTQFQAEWLDFILSESEQKWNVVTFHQPVYSTSAGRNEPVLRELWVPVFQKHNIDIVQMGHDHTYARGFNNDDKTETDGITNGPVYVVSNSGAKHYNLETEEKNVWTLNGATQVKRSQGLTTYQVIDVTADTMTYRSYIAEVNGNYNSVPGAAVGDLYDEFTITKSDAGVKYVTEAGIEAPVDPDGGDTDGNTDGGDTDGNTDGGDTDGNTDGGDTDGNTDGGDTDGNTDGGDTDGNTDGGDTDGNTDGGDTDGNTDGGDTNAGKNPGTGDDDLAQTGAGQVGLWAAIALALVGGSTALLVMRRKVKADM